MKKILIVEDEVLASEKLMQILQECLEEDLQFSVIETVEECIQLFKKGSQSFDMGFFDIQLADGDSFVIFEECEIRFPVLFTTAYDNYIMKALEEQAIDYILKPVKKERMQQALNKLDRLRSHFSKDQISRIRSHSAPSRFLVKKGLDFKSVPLKEISYIFSEHKMTFLVTKDSETFIHDKTLSELTNLLESHNYFRLNRQYLVSLDAIDKFRSENGKVRVYLTPPTKDEIHVSKENAPNFRKWISDEVE